MRRNSFIIIALLLMGMTACQPNQDKRMLEKYTHPFPRLGMWWLNPYETDVEDMARYDLLLDSFDDEYLQERLQDIKKINPKQLNVKPLSPTERQLFAYDWEEAVYYPNPEVTRLPSSFFLLQTGTNLVENLDAKETMVFVESMYDKKGQPLFHIDGEVAIGESESAKIVEIFWE
ncbi:MAG: hypothetical protein JW708_11480, partial [Vallitaleaceae bacterium]|nr:hypothetical protein [Vallitaleaceae bacterium]